MHFNRLGKTNSFSTQSFYSCSQCKVFTLYGLGVFLADSMFFGVYITLITAPVICIEHIYTKRLQKDFQLLENDIFSASESESKYSAGIMVYGEPKPTLIFFALDKTPQFIKFCFLSFIPFLPKYDFHADTVFVYTVYVMMIDIAYEIFSFFNVLVTLDLDIFSTLDMSRIPEAFAVISMIDASIPGLLPL